MLQARFAGWVMGSVLLVGSAACGSDVDLFGDDEGLGGDGQGGGQGNIGNQINPGGQGGQGNQGNQGNSAGSGNQGGVGTGGAGPCDPNAVDLPNGADDDCDGTADNGPAPCDQAILLATDDPEEAAEAMELCKKSSGAVDWGLASATWMQIDGTPVPGNNFHIGHGVVDDFGPNVSPKAGGAVLLLSTGTARRPTDPGFESPVGFDKNYASGHAPGFPKEAADCPGVTTSNAVDSIALQVVVRVPSNATGFRYRSTFYAQDWPAYVCSQFSDYTSANLTPAPPGGLLDGNIAFAPNGSPISVNAAPFEACGCLNGPPCTAGGKSYTCSLGTSLLLGTGFGNDVQENNHGATGWYAISAPVTPGSEITLRLGITDAGDGISDSTVVLDGWEWLDGAVAVDTVAEP